jgi:hypothetical protein
MYGAIVENKNLGDHLTPEAPVVLHYLKAPTAVKLTAVWFIAF